MKLFSGADQEWLWMELAHAVRQEAPLDRTLAELAVSHAGTRRGAMAEQLADSIASGMSLSEAIEAEGNRFGPGVAVTIESGEKSDALAEVLDGLCENADAEGNFREAILVAVAYPLVLALVALVAVFFINVKLWPMFQAIFDELDITTPVLTQAFPTLLQSEAFLLLLVPTIALIALYVIPPVVFPFRAVVDFLRMRFPVIGRVVHSIVLARWCRSMGMLTSANVDEPTAVRLSGESSGNAWVKQVSGRVAKSISAGETLAEAMTEHWFFPEALVWVVDAGREAGGHAHVWRTASELYDNRAETTAHVMSIILRIVFVLLALQIVGVTVMAAFLPLIQLMNSL